MTYNVIFDVPAPIELYDVTHAALRDVVGTEDIGLLAHIGRATDAGFEVTEIWSDKESFDAFIRDIWPKVASKIPGAADMEAPAGREFDVRGLIITGRDDLYV